MDTQKRFLVLTPFERPEVLWAMLNLRGITADVVSTRSGSAVVGSEKAKVYDDWDISELLGAEEPAAPDAAGDPGTPQQDQSFAEAPSGSRIAAYVSEFSPVGVVLLTAQLGEDVGNEAGVSGMVHGCRYLNGKIGEEVSAGMVLNFLDPLIEALLLGHADASQMGEKARKEGGKVLERMKAEKDGEGESDA